MIIDWDTYFMSIAVLSSLRSKDPVTQVGCCIVDDRNRVISCGYNGMVNVPNNDALFSWEKSEDPILNKQSYVIHSEANGILNAPSGSVRGCRIYTTLFPCNECCKLIVQSGIREVIYLRSKDRVFYHISKHMMDLCGVKHRQLTTFSFPNIQGEDRC